MTVGKCFKLYRDLGLVGLRNQLRAGRPRIYKENKVSDVSNRDL
jgi:hypothetical protein